MIIPAAPDFTGSPLNRTEENRPDETTLSRWRTRPDTRIMLLDQLDPLISQNGALEWLAPDAIAPTAQLLFLGLEGDAPRFAALKQSDLSDTANSRSSARQSIWKALSTMPAGDCAIYACARSLAEWHARNGFCGVCGTSSHITRGGWARQCTSCSTEHFPRTDPVVIMLAVHNDHVLIGRQHGFPPRRYSALAGFIEVGESIEEAVSRELYEEAGVVTTSVRYVASQPWPFPSSLMIACLADVASSALTLDTNELEHAFWADRNTVRAAFEGSGDFLAPPPYAIAHTLLRRWADNTA